MSTLAAGRVSVTITEEQARAWAAKLERHSREDSDGRGPRWWGVRLGLHGANLGRVLAELGEAAAPAQPAVLRARRGFYVRQALPYTLPRWFAALLLALSRLSEV